MSANTERRNPRSVDIDILPTERILQIINEEDATVPAVVGRAIPEIAKAVDLAVATIKNGGRLIYVGAGTSGRIAILDAAECPATFSVPSEWIHAIMAGGVKAFAQPVEAAEDDREQARMDLEAEGLSGADMVVGVAASGKTPYTQAALEYGK